MVGRGGSFSQWRKVKTNATFVKMHPLRLNQPEDSYEEAGERKELFPSVLCPKLGWQVTLHCEVLGRGSLSLLSHLLTASTHTVDYFFWHYCTNDHFCWHSRFLLQTTSSDTADYFYCHYWLLLLTLLTDCLTTSTSETTTDNTTTSTDTSNSYFNYSISQS